MDKEFESRAEKILDTALSGQPHDVKRGKSRIEDLLMDLVESGGGSGGESSTVTSSSINGNIRVNGSEMTVYDDTEIREEIESKSGSSNYDSLNNKPSINGTVLSGELTTEDLQLASEKDLDNKVGFTDYPDDYTAGAVKMSAKSTSSNGVYRDASGVAQLVPTTDKDVQEESYQQKAVMCRNIPGMMKNYGIDSRTKLSSMNEALVAAINAGQKNLIDMSNVPNTIVNGITIVNDNNGSLTLKGEFSKSVNGILVYNIESGNIKDSDKTQIYGQFIKDPGEYICYCPGLSSQLRFQIYYADSKDGEMVQAVYTQDEVTYFTMDTTHEFVWCRIWLKANANFSEEGITIRPMICKKEYWDLTQAYQRYVMSNKELTDKIKDKVGFEDYAKTDEPGVVKVSQIASSQHGIYMPSDSNRITIVEPSDERIFEGVLKNVALTLSKIHVMMSNYGIDSRQTIPDMQREIAELKEKLKE